MPFNGSGTFTRVYSWVADLANGLFITASRMDADTNDIAAGLSDCITRDGQSPATADLPMGGHNFTGLSSATTTDGAATLGQLQTAQSLTQTGLATFAVATGTGDAMAASLSPAITGIADGQEVRIRVIGPNTLNNPTLNINALGAKTITKLGGQPLLAKDYVSGQEAIFRFVSAGPRWEILEPSQVNYIHAGTHTVEQTVAGALDTDAITAIALGCAGDGATDCVPFISNLTGSARTVHFSLVGNGPTTYFFGAFSAPAFDGLTFSADLGVTLSFAVDTYGLYANILFGNDISIFFRNLSIAYVFRKTPNIFQKAAVAPARIVPRALIPLDCTTSVVKNLQVTYPGGDTFTAATGATPGGVRSVAYAANASNAVGSFVDLGVGESIEFTFASATTFGTMPIGIMIRCVGGYITYTRPATTVGTALSGTIKPIGTAQSALQGLSYPGMGSYTSFEPDLAVFAVLRTAHDRAILMLNGSEVSTPEIITSAIGDITSVGIVALNPTIAFSTLGFTLRRAPPEAAAILNISIFGDSNAASFPNSWMQLINESLDTRSGIKVGVIANNGVVGQTAAQCLATMQSVGFGSSFYVVVGIGANDIQGLTNPTAFQTTITAMASLISSSGRRGIFITPYMYYGQAQSGGTGQTSVNYDQGYFVRVIMPRLLAESGMAVIDPCRLLPNPAPSLIGSGQDILVRDNIHYDRQVHQRITEEVSNSIMTDFFHRGRNWQVDISPYLTLAGTTIVGGTFVAQMNEMGAVSIQGTLTFTTPPTAGITIGTLPRYLWPTTGFNFGCEVFSGSTASGHAIFNISVAGAIALSITSVSCTGVVIFANYQVPWL